MRVEMKFLLCDNGQMRSKLDDNMKQKKEEELKTRQNTYIG